MTDCPNAEIRDLLPDYLHEQLSSSEQATVDAHLAVCRACADELALLKAVLAVRPIRTANVSAIVRALPTAIPAAAVEAASNSGRDAVGAGVRSIASAPSVRTRRFGMREWRAIAAVALVAVGGMSVIVAKRGVMAVADVPPMNDSAAATQVGALGATTPAVAQVAESAAGGTAATPSKAPALSVGELSDYSDAELESVIQRLDKWDGAAAAEPLPGVPLLPVSASGAPGANPGGIR